MTQPTQAELDRQLRVISEAMAKVQARQTGNAVTYKDTDGCEVTVTPDGHVFYNAADWW
jgi:hypothetical protein